MNGSISLKDPSAILALMLIIGMVLGPWIMHERTLSRMEYKMDNIERQVSELKAKSESNEAILAERKKDFEGIMQDLRSEFQAQKYPNTQP